MLKLLLEASRDRSTSLLSDTYQAAQQCTWTVNGYLREILWTNPRTGLGQTPYKFTECVPAAIFLTLESACWDIQHATLPDHATVSSDNAEPSRTSQSVLLGLKHLADSLNMAREHWRREMFADQLFDRSAQQYALKQLAVCIAEAGKVSQANAVMPCVTVVPYAQHDDIFHMFKRCIVSHPVHAMLLVTPKLGGVTMFGETGGAEGVKAGEKGLVRELVLTCHAARATTWTVTAGRALPTQTVLSMNVC